MNTKERPALHTWTNAALTHDSLALCIRSW